MQQLLKDNLVPRLEHLEWVTPPDAPFKENLTVRIKVSGDGTTIGKRLHVVNFTYTILDERDLAHSYKGNHSLAIFCAPENYDSLKSALEDIVNEVASLEFITVGEKQYKVEYYMGGDWKFLATVTGAYIYK